jgi:predicted membrane metal-binding protein
MTTVVLMGVIADRPVLTLRTIALAALAVMVMVMVNVPRKSAPPA